MTDPTPLTAEDDLGPDCGITGCVLAPGHPGQHRGVWEAMEALDRPMTTPGLQAEADAARTPSQPDLPLSALDPLSVGEPAPVADAAVLRVAVPVDGPSAGAVVTNGGVDGGAEVLAGAAVTGHLNTSYLSVSGRYTQPDLREAKWMKTIGSGAAASTTAVPETTTRMTRWRESIFAAVAPWHEESGYESLTDAIAAIFRDGWQDGYASGRSDERRERLASQPAPAVPESELRALDGNR